MKLLLHTILLMTAATVYGNTPPEIVSGEPLYLNKNTPSIITSSNLVNATMAQDQDGDAIYFLVQQISSGKLEFNGAPAVAGKTLVGPNDTLTWTPPTNVVGTTVGAFSVRAYDLTAYSADTAEVWATISGNSAPTFTHVDPFLFANGESVELLQTNTYTYSQLLARSDAWDEDGDTISLRIVSVGAGVLTLNGNPVVAGVSTITPADVISWTAQQAGGQVLGFTLDAYDGHEYSASPVGVYFDVTKSSKMTNVPPLVFNGQILNGRENTDLVISYDDLVTETLASDPDDDSVSFLVTTASAGLLKKAGVPVTPGVTTFGPGETLVWTPPTNVFDASVTAFSVKAFDGQDYSSNEASISVWLKGNHAPEFVSLNPFLRANFEAAHLGETNTYTFQQLIGRSTVRDMDDDPIVFRLVSVGAGTVLVNGVDAQPGVSLIGPHDSLSWVPATAGSRIAAFVLDAYDGQDYSTNKVAVLIDVYNAVPSFTRGPDISFLRGDLNRCDAFLAGWARNIQPYDASLTFVISNDNAGLFLSQPDITSDGELYYSVNPEAYGSANVTVRLVDDQGRQSAPVVVKFNVQFVNLPPYVEHLPSVTVNEDAGLCVITNFFSYVSPGSTWEAWQTLTFTATPTTASLYSVKPYFDAAGTLYFKTATNVSGADVVTLVVKDNGGTTNHGQNTMTSSFTINILPVNDPPQIKNSTFTMMENSVLRTNLTVTDVDDDVNNAVISVVSFDPQFLASVDVVKSGNSNVLVLTPRAGAIGTNQITLAASDGKDQSIKTATIVINNANDPPHFSLATTRVTGDYVTGKIVVPAFVQLIDKGGPGEDNQIVTYLATASAPQLFKIKPTVSPSGTLQYQLVDNLAAGTEITVNIVAKDNGGTNNISPVQSFAIVVPENPFVGAAGVYNGLFYDQDGAENNSTGSYSATVNDKGVYSGKVMIEGGAYSFSGRFSVSKATQAQIVRPGKSTLVSTLTIDANQINGSIGDGTWIAQVAADRAAYSAVSPTTLAGKYTMMMPKTADGPAGNSIAFATVTPSGAVNMVVNLADGTTVSRSTTLSRRAQAPLFASLYNGGGSVVSWLTLNSSRVSGDATWIKTAQAGNPFSSQTTLDGSVLTPAPAGQRLLNVTNVTLVVDTPDYGTVQVGASLTVKNTLVTQNPALASLTLNTASGLISGTVRGASGGTPTTVKAVVLQQQTTIGGYAAAPKWVGVVSDQ